MFKNFKYTRRLSNLVELLGVKQTLKFCVAHIINKDSIVKLNIADVPTPLFCRVTGSDIWVLWRIFGMRELEIELDEAPSYIVDGGAYSGITAVFFANKFPHAEIVAVEPDSANCALFALNTQEYANINLVNAALWKNEAKLTIENPEDPSWMFRVVETSGEGIPAVTVRDVMDKFDLPHIDLLKLDIEGSERMLFEANSDYKAWVDQTKMLMIELHDRYMPGCREAVVDALQPEDFTWYENAEYTVFERDGLAEPSVMMPLPVEMLTL